MTTWHVHEEIQLLAIDFSTMLFETMAPDADVAGLLPGPRPDAALRVPEDGAQGLPVPAGRRPLDPQVAPAPRAVRAADLDVPRRHRAGHPPRPGVGDGLDGDDGRLLGPHVASTRSTPPASPATGRTGSRRCSTPRCATATCSPPTSRWTSASATSWPTTSAPSGGSTSWPTSRSRPRRRRPSQGYIDSHQRDRHGKVVYEPEALGLDVAARRRGHAGLQRALRRPPRGLGLSPTALRVGRRRAGGGPRRSRGPSAPPGRRPSRT